MAKNQAPKIVSDGGGAIAAKVVFENSLSVTTVAAKDADKDKLVYSIKGADAALFSINSATGVVAFKAKPNFEDPLDVGKNNIYNITASVSDGKAVDTQTVVIAILNVNEAPAISSNGGGSTASVTADENTTLATTVRAADEDSKGLRYSINGGADAAKFGIDATTGALSFLVAPDFEQPTDQNGNNVYEVVVAASDGKSTDTQAMAISVADLQEQTLPGPGNDVLVGTDEYNYFDISAGGDDTVTGLGAYDYILAGAALNSDDRIDGGDDVDLLMLQGDYSAGLLIGGDTVRNVEYIDLAGAYTYKLAFKDDFLAPGQHVEIRNYGSTISVTLDASAETESGASYFLQGGRGNDFLIGGASSDLFRLGLGGDDTVYGGGGGDRIDAEASFDENDIIDGGPGDSNGLTVQGDYSRGVTLTATNFKNMNYIVFDGTGDYYFIATDGILFPGQSLEVYGEFLDGSSSLKWDGSSETDASASFVISGGQGMDVLTGGAGNDSFRPGRGLDTMTGGGGRDAFEIVQIAEQDSIMDFAAGAGGDILRIAWLVQGFSSAAASDFIRLTELGGGTILSTDRDGAGTDYQFQDAVHLVGVTGLTLSALLADGNLVTTL